MKKALVLSLALVLGLSAASFAQTLTGTWDTKVTITPSPILLQIESTLSVTYTVSGWHFTSKTVLKDTGWTDQVFTADGALGAFTLKSTLDFDPTPLPPTFKSWVVEGGLSLAGVTFKATFTLTGGSTQLALTADGTAGNVHINVALNLGDALAGCDFDFNNVVIKVDFPFCCATVYSELKISCAGFDYVSFTVKGIDIPNLPWVNIDAVMKFTMTEKTLVLTPKFDWGSFLCADIKLYINQTATGNLSLGDFTFDGIGLTCMIGGVKFEELSYWGEHGTKPSVLGTYWEMFKISTTADGCCGGKFGFDLAVFFDHGAQLFDVSKIVANVSVNVTSNFVFKSGITLDLAQSPAFTQWSVQFVVTW